MRCLALIAINHMSVKTARQLEPRLNEHKKETEKVELSKRNFTCTARKQSESEQSKSAIADHHSQIQDFVVEHVVRTECVLPASLQSTYRPSTSVGTLPQNSKSPTTW